MLQCFISSRLGVIDELQGDLALIANKLKLYTLLKEDVRFLLFLEVRKSSD